MNPTALLVVDVQRGLFKKSTPIYQADKLIGNITLLIDRAHKANVPVFFIQHASEKTLRTGTKAWQFHSQIQPLETDLVIPKNHGSAFEQTTLKAELDTRHIRQVVVMGLVTQGCIRAACLEAHRLGYTVILVRDGHSNYHQQVREIIDEWNAKLSAGIVELREAQQVNFDKLGSC